MSETTTGMQPLEWDNRNGRMRMKEQWKWNQSHGIDKKHLKNVNGTKMEYGVYSSEVFQATACWAQTLIFPPPGYHKLMEVNKQS